MRQKQSDIATNPPPSIKLDVERYDHLLNNTSLTPDQRREFLEVMWDLIVGFVDMGFQVEPLDDTCGQVAPGSMESGNRPDNALYSKGNSLIDKFESAEASVQLEQRGESEQ